MLVLGPELSSDIINASGDWHSLSINSEYTSSFTIIDEYGNKTTRVDNNATLRGKGSLSMESPVRKITVTCSGNGRIIVTANYLASAGSEDYTITIAGDVVSRTIPLTVFPTHHLEIESVSYTLDTWETYLDYTYEMDLTATTYQPVDIAGDYEFSYIGVGQLESRGQMIFDDGSDIARALCEARSFYIEVPSSTGYEYMPWSMEGDEMLLSSEISELTFHHLPPQPRIEILPSTCSPRLTLTAIMERTGFRSKFIVRNPASETKYTLYGTLIIDMPVKIKGTYEIL